jgi:hypothetical protein
MRSETWTRRGGGGKHVVIAVIVGEMIGWRKKARERKDEVDSPFFQLRIQREHAGVVQRRLTGGLTNKVMRVTC